MKKLTAVLLALLILLSASAVAEDLSSKTDDELISLLDEVFTELESRGIVYDRQAAPEVVAAEVFTNRVLEFFSAWSKNDLDGMLALCDNSWKEAQENPRTALFGLLANRTPISCQFDAPADETEGTRSVAATALVDRHNGKDPERYRYTIVMKKGEDGLWYLDADCLKTSERVDNDEGYGMPQETSPTGGLDWSKDEYLQTTILYYVPNGGEKYHLDEYCKAVNDKYLPMEGAFIYRELNYDDYKDLKPCQVCGAPPRDYAPTELTGFNLNIYDRSGLEKVSYIRADYYAGEEKRGFICSCPNEGEDFCRFPIELSSQEELQNLRIEFSYGVSDLAPEDAILEVMKGSPVEEHPLLTQIMDVDGGRTVWMALEPDGADGWKLTPAE